MLGVIGGSGFYDITGVRVTDQRPVKTPFGAPSAPLTLAETTDGAPLVFLPRHGGGHGLLPSEINYRANLWALKEAGVRQVLSVSAVGSLQPELEPGHFVIPSQYIDWTKGGRPRTFFGDGLIAHVSTAQPVCPNLANALATAANDLGFTAHADKTYLCVEGPRLGTRAESLLFKNVFAADVVGMTNVPEVFLAREAQLSYASLGVVTDFDCWLDDPSRHVSVKEVIENFGHSIGRAKSVIARILDRPPAVDEAHRQALATAILTPVAAQTEAHRRLLAVLTR